ncbi:TPA: hypothetical protein VBM32_002185 [Streptococcus agalactiae]|nr:hypothetical protein [Streptococcus agalactiae]
MVDLKKEYNKLVSSLDNGVGLLIAGNLEYALEGAKLELNDTLLDEIEEVACHDLEWQDDFVFYADTHPDARLSEVYYWLVHKELGWINAIYDIDFEEFSERIELTGTDEEKLETILL